MWVANFGSNNVAVLNVSNGALVRTVSVGTNPNGIAFDGTNMWVANDGSNTVTKIQPAPGHILEPSTGVTGAFGLRRSQCLGDKQPQQRRQHRIKVVDTRRSDWGRSQYAPVGTFRRFPPGTRYPRPQSPQLSRRETQHCCQRSPARAHPGPEFPPRSEGRQPTG